MTIGLASHDPAEVIRQMRAGPLTDIGREGLRPQRRYAISIAARRD
jgi:hypothetical protein